MADLDTNLPSSETQLPEWQALESLEQTKSTTEGQSLQANLDLTNNPKTAVLGAQGVRAANTVVLPATTVQNGWNFGSILKQAAELILKAAQSVFKTLENGVVALFGTKGPFKKYGGTVLLAIAGGVGTFLILHFLHNGSPKNPIESLSTTGASQKNATAMIASLHETSQAAAEEAAAAGADPTTMQIQTQVTELSYGTPIVISSIKSTDPSLPTDKLSYVTKVGSPVQYLDVSHVNTVHYLNALNETDPSNAILDNSSVVHGADR